MPLLRRARALALCASLLPTSAPFLLAPPAARSQVFDFQNVVMLSREDVYGAALTGEKRYMDLWGFVGTDGREYIIQTHTGGTLWWDVEDPVHPVLLKEIGGPVSPWRDVFIIGNHAYASSENATGGIQIFDIADPTDPVAVGAYTTTVGSAHNIFGDVSRQLLYVVGGFENGANGGLQILDASDPVNLVEIGQWSNRYIHDISAEGNILYACLINNFRLRPIDATDPTNPVSFGTAFQDPSGDVHASWPLGDGVHLFLCEERMNGRLRELDISDPFNITQVDELAPFPNSSAHNVHVQGNRVYVSWYEEGTRIIDASDPANLTEIGWFDTFPGDGDLFAGNWGVYPHLPSGIIAASDRTYGLFLFSYDTDVATLQGTVSSDVDGPLPGASVHYAELENTLRTDNAGLYRFSAFPGPTHQLVASAFGHDPDSVTVAVGAGGTTIADIVLVKQPTGAVDGVVTDAVSGLPLEAADVELVSQGESFAASTDAAGQYTFASFPQGGALVRVVRYGYAPQEAAVVIPAGGSAPRNFALQPGAIAIDFSSAPGWTVVNDTTGFWYGGTWELGVPPTMTNWNQPTLDHTLDPEDMCWVTGLADTSDAGLPNLVHNGSTTVTSPPFDLSGMAEPHVFYYRWFWSTSGGDDWLVQASADGTTWVDVERSRERSASWMPVDVDLTPLVAPRDSVRVRFVAQQDGTSLGVEAGVDDLTLYDGAGGAVGAPGLPAVEPGLRLAMRPNPFAAAASVAFALPVRGRAKLTVHDVRGARIATLVDEVLDPGVHRRPWNGRNEAGGAVATGVYFLRLESAGRMTSQKVVRVR
ncbi:choice-of-anchor B family protein [bacterium]|nr:choice-of-anchor B family protein [bacterium]